MAPSATPGDVSFASVGVMLVPVSASAGPLHRSGSVWSCYAHTPMGAVIAAHVIVAELTTPQWRTVADQAVVHDTARATFLRLAARQPAPHFAPDDVPSPVGWQIATYTPTQVTVQVLTATDQAHAWNVTTRTLTWDHGDWKLAMTPAGAPGTDPQTLATTSGFIKWDTHG